MKDYVGPFNWVPRRWMRRSQNIMTYRASDIVLTVNGIEVKGFAAIAVANPSEGFVVVRGQVPATVGPFVMNGVLGLFDWFGYTEDDYTLIIEKRQVLEFRIHTATRPQVALLRWYLRRIVPSYARLDMRMSLPVQNWLVFYRAGALDD